jgi:hypothetical protein
MFDLLSFRFTPRLAAPVDHLEALRPFLLDALTAIYDHQAQLESHRFLVSFEGQERLFGMTRLPSFIVALLGCREMTTDLNPEATLLPTNGVGSCLASIFPQQCPDSPVSTLVLQVCRRSRGGLR